MNRRTSITPQPRFASPARKKPNKDDAELASTARILRGVQFPGEKIAAGNKSEA